jgi:FkbM family methyltransferase
MSTLFSELKLRLRQLRQEYRDIRYKVIPFRVLNLHARIFGRPRFANFNKLLLMLGQRGLGIRNFRSSELSGEIPFTKRILPKVDCREYTLLDIGANEGTFTGEVLENTKYLNIVAIEPHPQTFERLNNGFANNGRVTPMNIGAGDREGTLPLYDYCDRKGSSHASFFKGVIEDIHHGASSELEVRVRRLDNVVSEKKLNVVFIKIDVEGYELSVLRGLEETIRLQKVPYILIEFNEMNVFSRTFLKDLMGFLNDYEPFRILPHGRLLGLRPYRAFWVEVFAYQNIVFIIEDLV